MLTLISGYIGLVVKLLMENLLCSYKLILKLANGVNGPHILQLLQ